MDVIHASELTVEEFADTLKRSVVVQCEDHQLVVQASGECFDRSPAGLEAAITHVEGRYDVDTILVLGDVEEE